MMMRQMPLGCGEQLLLGLAGELRPALAEGDPSVSAARHGLVNPITGGWASCACTENFARETPVLTVGSIKVARYLYVSRTLPVVRSANERTRVQLCGRLSVEVDGAQLAGRLRGKQVPLLLAYLLLNRSRHVGRDELIGVLWPDKAPVSQDGALRTLLSRLRFALGSETLIGRDELILDLPDPVWIDLEAAAGGLERAQRALDVGDHRAAWALAQVPLNISGRGLLPGAHASWLEPRRRELEDIRLQALEVVGRAGLELGGRQLGSVRRAARSLIEAEPYRESGYVLLMQGLAAEGNVAEGLRVFDGLRTLLRTELGTLPSPETIAVHERLLHRDDRYRRRRSGDGAAESSAIALPAELRARGQVPLIGRDRELAELRHLWALGLPESDHDLGEASPAGRRVVMLTGDPGIGKTHLISELARSAYESGATVLAGRCPQEALAPYQPFVEALRHYVLSAELDDLRRSAREFAAELAPLAPELQRRLPELARRRDTEPLSERYRLFEAFIGFLTEISATAPVLLVLDDLHWADRPTLLLLRHVARAPALHQVLVLGAYRSTETPGVGFAEALTELGRDRLMTPIDLGGLTEAETAELVGALVGRTPSPFLSRALHEQTEGNPFFVEEIIRHLREAGVEIDRARAGDLYRVGLPQRVKEVIARRLESLDVRAMECLRAASVIGRDFGLPLLERVVSLDEDELLAALDAVIDAGLISEAPSPPGSCSFSHALIRETLYEGMSAPRRARFHRRIAEALEQAGAQDDRQLIALALHFTRAASPENAGKAIEYATRAGRQTTSLLAHEEAAGHYQRALEVQEQFQPEARALRCELLLLRGEAQMRAGERPPAWEALREAAGIATALGDSAGIARAAIGASHRYVQQPGVVDGELIALLEQALEVVAGQRTLARIQLLARLCGALYFSPERARMHELSAEAMEIAEALDDSTARAYAFGAVRRANWEPGRLSERLSAATSMLTCARETGDLELELQAHGWLIVDLLERGEIDAVDAQLEVFAAGAERLRQPLYLWNAAVWRAMRTILAGRLDEAERLALDALALGAGTEQITAPHYYAIQVFLLRREQGRLDELLGPAREFAGTLPAVPAWRAVFGWLQAELGQADEARATFDLLAADAFGELPRDGNWIAALCVLTELCVRLGDPHRAESLYALLLPFADLNVTVALAIGCLGSAERYLGLLAAISGRPERAIGHFERAIEANAALQAPVILAHTQLDLAGLLPSESPRAAELISAAADIAQALGLPTVRRRLPPPQ
jgi:DNA-binding SARP family transcriptional activator